MTKRIFKAVSTTAMLVLLVTLGLIFAVLYEYFTSVQARQLRAQTTLAAQAVEQLGVSYFTDLKSPDCRLTWVAADGSVLYDTASDTQENHLEREEIQQAIKTGYGESSRYSNTLMQRSIYCAQRLKDGSVLRLSIAHSSVLLLFLGMLQPILLIVIAALVLSFLLASRLSKRIVEPMNQLNLDEPLENEGYDELSPLLRRIYAQQQQLKEQEQTLHRKQNELDTIVGNMEEGMILLDGADKVLAINAAAMRLLDAPEAKVGDDLLTVTRAPEIQQAVTSGQAQSVRTQLHGRDIQISTAPVQPSGTAVVLFDITEQEQSERRRREFTANVSHELKTPLQSISGYSELLSCGIAKPEDVQPFAGQIYHEAQRLIALVSDIINLSHLDEGGKMLQWSQVDLYEQAALAVQALTDIAQKSGITLHLEGASYILRGVPDLIFGIIYNLCDNAIKYNRPNGSVTVRVEENVLRVADTGIGIPAEEQDRIFERFYRVDKGRSKELGGTGLGLSIVKHAAIIHQAKIQMQSTVGKGTEITVTFPKEA